MGYSPEGSGPHRFLSHKVIRHPWMNEDDLEWE
jgi:hypothetical protein